MRFTRWLVLNGLFVCIVFCVCLQIRRFKDQQLPTSTSESSIESTETPKLEIHVEPIDVPGRDSMEASIAQAMTVALLKLQEPDWLINAVKTTWNEDHYNVRVEYLDESGEQQTIDLQLVPGQSDRDNAVTGIEA